MMKFLFKIIIGWGISVLTIYIVSAYILNDFNYDSWQILVLVGLGFGVISALARPFLKILSIPFPLIGLLLLFVVNSFILYFLGAYIPGFHPGNSMTTILEAGVIIAAINFILRLLVK